MKKNIENILEVKNLYMKYKKKDKNFVLENLNFSIEKGSFHAFIGENGAGKSTTIKIISGLNNEYEGDVYINKLDIKNDVSARNKFLYVPDKTFFPSKISVFDYLFNITTMTRNDPEKIKLEIKELMEKYGIIDVIDRNPNKLSSGQIKKISLVQAILTKEIGRAHV